MKLSPIFPELRELHKQVKKPCILDGELIVMEAGRPAFAQVQHRALMSNRVRIEMLVAKLPASFVAYDILYYDGKQLTDQPLMKRKEILAAAVKEGEQLAVSRYVPERGKSLFELTAQQQLEGVVGKRRDSLYYPGRRTPD